MISRLLYDDGNGKHVSIKTVEDSSTVFDKLNYFRTFERRLNQILKNSINQHTLYDQKPTPTVHSWFTTAHAIFIILTNGYIQINFYDHSKLILTSTSVTFINNGDGKIITNLFIDLIEFGVPQRYRKKFLYIQDKIQYFLKSLQ